MYPEDITRGCLACGEGYPKSDQNCQRCQAWLCVTCKSQEHRGFCIRCSFWMITEMRAAVDFTNCPICDIELDQDSTERCLKCHAAKCQECDVDQTFCIRCDTRIDIHQEWDVSEDDNTEIERGAAPGRLARPARLLSTHCNYCCTSPLCVGCENHEKRQVCTRCIKRFMGAKMLQRNAQIVPSVT